MKRYFFYSLLFITFVSTVFTSCNKGESTPDATTGVIVRSVMQDGVVVYGTLHQVFTNIPMDTVIVTDPSGAVFGLHKNEGNPHIFLLEPELSQFRATPPMEGAFTYKVRFQNGVEKSFSNSISDPYLTPSQNISVTQATVNNVQAVVLSWDAIPNADAYSFTVTAGTTQIYNSDQLFTLVQGQNGKINFPLSGFSSYTGQTILFKVIAYDLINDTAVINSISWSTASWVAQ
jgi:hypothetical protein